MTPTPQLLKEFGGHGNLKTGKKEDSSATTAALPARMSIGLKRITKQSGDHESGCAAAGVDDTLEKMNKRLPVCSHAQPASDDSYP